MVKGSYVQLDIVLGALSDPTRRAIVQRLFRGEASVTDLARPFRISLPAVSKHIRILEQAGLVERRVDGRLHLLSLNPAALRQVSDWIDEHRRFWEERLTALTTYLESETDAILIPPSTERSDR